MTGRQKTIDKLNSAPLEIPPAYASVQTRLPWLGHHADKPQPPGDSLVNLHLSLTPIISLLAGILILILPRLLNFIVAIYLIVIGVVGLLGPTAFHFN